MSRLTKTIGATGAAFLLSVTVGMTASTNAQDRLDPDHPFGALDVRSAGSTPEQVGAFATNLSGRELIELIGRCQTVLTANGGPGMGISQQAGTQDSAHGDIATTAGSAFAKETLQLCRNLNSAVFGYVPLDQQSKEQVP